MIIIVVLGSYAWLMRIRTIVSNILKEGNVLEQSKRSRMVKASLLGIADIILTVIAYYLIVIYS